MFSHKLKELKNRDDFKKEKKKKKKRRRRIPLVALN
jgi:hypothetical protein